MTPVTAKFSFPPYVYSNDSPARLVFCVNFFEGVEMETEQNEMLVQKVEERRNFDRFPILKKASLMFEGQDLDVTIFDISGGGAKIRIDDGIIPSEDKINAAAILDVPECGIIEGYFVWKDDEYFGLGFNESHSKLISLLIN